MMITNSIEIAQTIKSSGSDIELILLGGQLVSDVPATYGELTLSEIRRFNVDLAFIGPVAVHAAEGMFSFALKEAEIASTMITQARQSVLLCDRTKLGTTSRVCFAKTRDINYMVTDNLAKSDQIEPFTKAGIEIVTDK